MQGGNEKFSYILRTVAGAYLCYLSYSILRAVMNGETGGHSVLVSVCAVAFIIIGVILMVWGVRGMKMVSKQQAEEAAQAEEVQEEETVETLEEQTAEALEDSAAENQEEQTAQDGEKPNNHLCVFVIKSRSGITGNSYVLRLYYLLCIFLSEKAVLTIELHIRSVPDLGIRVEHPCMCLVVDTCFYPRIAVDMADSPGVAQCIAGACNHWMRFFCDDSKSVVADLHNIAVYPSGAVALRFCRNGRSILPVADASEADSLTSVRAGSQLLRAPCWSTERFHSQSRFLHFFLLFPEFIHTACPGVRIFRHVHFSFECAVI